MADEGKTAGQAGTTAEDGGKAKDAGTKGTGKASGKSSGKSSGKAPSIDVSPAVIRTRVAQLVWLLCVVAALFLALGALMIALDFNESNTAVDFVLSGADYVDLNVFTREGGLKEFTGGDAATKNALVNYGLGAVFWLVLGRVVDRFVRP